LKIKGTLQNEVFEKERKGAKMERADAKGHTIDEKRK
jgi:hypothetical protein